MGPFTFCQRSSEMRTCDLFCSASAVPKRLYATFSVLPARFRNVYMRPFPFCQRSSETFIWDLFRSASTVPKRLYATFSVCHDIGTGHLSETGKMPRAVSSVVICAVRASSVILQSHVSSCCQAVQWRHVLRLAVCRYSFSRCLVSCLPVSSVCFLRVLLFHPAFRCFLSVFRRLHSPGPPCIRQVAALSPLRARGISLSV